jgi:uncharacterized membrane protein
MITLTPIQGMMMAQNKKICAISATLFHRIVNNANNSHGKVEKFALSLYDISMALAKDNNKNLDIRTIILPKYHDYVKTFEKASTDKLLKISATLFRRIVNNANNSHGKVEQFALSLYNISMALAKDNNNNPDIRMIILPKYHDYVKTFEKASTNKLLLHHPSDHTILLAEGFIPPFGSLYSLSHPELEELKCWLDKNLSKGFIRTSSSPTTAPILFVKKGDSWLRLVIHYRGINEETIKNRYPLPLLPYTLMNLSKAKWFTKLDIRGAYNFICMAEGKEWKTAFCTYNGLFKSIVMPFSLTNALEMLQNCINNILAPDLDCFCVAYLDDTLIHSDNFEEYQQHV